MRKESAGKNLFDHRVAMDSSEVSGSGNDNDHYFEFAFNARNFSDRVLRIEITLDFPKWELAARGCGGGVSSLRKEEAMQKAAEFTLNDDENIRSCDTLDLQDPTSIGKHDVESVAVIEVPPSGDEIKHRSDASLNLGCSTVLRVKSLFISSAILAAKSPFFYKLFSNGMQESEQQHATLRIHESEEAALMDLLSYMYSKKLSSSTIPALLDVLMAADKFEVASCMRHCSKLLCNLPMTQESALVYLDLPSSVSMASAVQPLLDSAKKYLATCYYNITKHQDEIMCLPLAAVEAILCSDNLQVPNEDAVYDFVLKWVQSQYPKGEERWEVLGSLLTRVVRFPHMTCRKLKRALLPLNEFDHELVSKLVIEALFFKAETYHKQQALASSKSSINYRYVERAYKYRPVKVVEFESPYRQCIVYLDLKHKECANLFPCGRVYSRAFHLGEQGFFLSAHCNIDQQSSSESFGLFLGMQEKGAAKLAVVYEFAARMRPTGEFASKYKGYYLFTGGKAVGYRNLFSIPWTTFTAEDSPYFINGVLHLRAELTIKQQQPTTVSAVQQ